jgi:hypothetical protein
MTRFLRPSRKDDEEREARTYADAIRLHIDDTDWGTWNRAIIARWSKTALLRVKTRAWQIIETEPPR